ncbi:MAG: hypothetical protein ABI741_00495 [Ferruginibacter sp.]
MKKKLLYYLLLLLFPAFSFAQEITGIWKGELYVDSTKKFYPFELTISEYKGKLTGYSRISFEENGIRQVVFRDHTIRIKDSSIIVEDDSQLAKASSISTPKEVKKVMILTLTRMDSSMQLSGTWSTNKTKRYLAASGSVKMQQKKDFKSTEIFKKLDSLSLAGKLSFNKPPVAGPAEEAIHLRLEKIELSGLASAGFPKKIITPPSKVVRPNPLIRPKEMPIARIEKALSPPEVKPVAVTTVAVKKPDAPVVKSTPVVKPKETTIAKVEKPPIPKTPAIVSKPAEKRNVVLPEQKNAAVDVAKRSVNSMQSFFYKSDSLQLTLYDNGEIDGDTVSVLLNGKVIIAKQGLNTRPNVHTIYFDKDSPDSMQLVMYAENLGSIPPNTGLLVIREGASIYEVRFSADLKTNAAVILRRKKGE